MGNLATTNIKQWLLRTIVPQKFDCWPQFLVGGPAFIWEMAIGIPGFFGRDLEKNKTSLLLMVAVDCINSKWWGSVRYILENQQLECKI